MLRLSTCAGGGVAPESLAAAKKVPVDCIQNFIKKRSRLIRSSV